MWKNLDRDVRNHSVYLTPIGSQREFLSQSKCSDQFDLTKNGSDILLKMTNSEEVYQPHQFCVTFLSDGILGAQIAKPKVQGGGGNQKFYPYILLCSSLFLLLTIIIYTRYSKKLLNFYTRVVRHFAFVLMMCFLMLATQKLWNSSLDDQSKPTSLAKEYPKLCETFGKIIILRIVCCWYLFWYFCYLSVCMFFKLSFISGFFQQYAFLSAFAFMTVMSYEIMLQLK